MLFGSGWMRNFFFCINPHKGQKTANYLCNYVYQYVKQKIDKVHKSRQGGRIRRHNERQCRFRHFDSRIALRYRYDRKTCRTSIKLTKCDNSYRARVLARKSCGNDVFLPLCLQNRAWPYMTIQHVSARYALIPFSLLWSTFCSFRNFKSYFNLFKSSISSTLLKQLN